MCMLPLTSYAQFTKGLSYQAETGVSFSGGEHTPFWLTANRGFRLLKRITGICVPVFFGSWKRINLSRMLSGRIWLSLIILLRLL